MCFNILDCAEKTQHPNFIKKYQVVSILFNKVYLQLEKYTIRGEIEMKDILKQKEQEIKKLKRMLDDERETIEILKKSL